MLLEAERFQSLNIKLLISKIQAFINRNKLIIKALFRSSEKNGR